TLVANEQRLANAIQTHLKKTLGLAVTLCAVESLEGRLQDADELLLLAIDQAMDYEEILRAAQNVLLRKLPVIILILGGDQAVPCSALARLEPYVDHRLYWPAEAATLVELVRDRVGRLRASPPDGEDSLVEIISRRLLAH